MKMRIVSYVLLVSMLLTLLAACGAPAAPSTPAPTTTVPTTAPITDPTEGEETVDYFESLYPVDGQIPTKRELSNIVKAMGKATTRISEINYTFTDGKVSMEVLAGVKEKEPEMTPPEESPLQLIYDQNEYYNYVLYLPEGYDPADTETKWPVIFFFHGIGEIGSDLNKIVPYGPLRYINKGGKLDAIVIAPQCPEGSHWADDNREENKLVKFVPQMTEQYNIDTSRMYLTGLSMGGRCTWKLALAMPDTFAAIAVICGRTNTYEFENFKNMPIWMFHGLQDGTVDFKNINSILTRLHEKEHMYYKLTVLPHGSHEIWHSIYDSPEIYEWLLSQTRLDME